MGVGLSGCPGPKDEATHAHGFYLSADAVAPVIEAAEGVEARVESVRAKLSAIPAGEQNTWAFQILGLAIGRTHLIRDTVENWANGIDIDAMIQLVLLKIADDARKDMREALDEMQETNAQRKALRDEMAKLRADQDALATAMREAYAKADRAFDAASNALVVGIVSSLSQVVAAGTGNADNEISTTIDANVGGQVEARADCALGPNNPGMVTLRIVDVLSGTPLYETKSSIGPVSATLELLSGAPLDVRLSFSSPNPTLSLKDCRLEVRYDKRVVPPTLVADEERRAIQALVPVRAQAIQGLATDFARAQSVVNQQQLPTDDLKTLAGILVHAVRDLNRSAEAMTLAEAEQARKDLRDQKDTLNEMGEMDILLIQQAMEKKDQLEQMISNALKAASEVGQAAIRALKAS